MDREEFIAFVSKNNDLEKRAREILDHAYPKNQYSIEKISFKEEMTTIAYYPGGGMNSDEFLEVPSRLFYVDDFRQQYSSWAESERKKENEKKAIEMVRLEEEGKRGRRELYERLKGEFEK